MTTETKIQPGDRIYWTSQAGGSSKTKIGEVIAFIPAGTNLFAVYPAASRLPRQVVKFDRDIWARYFDRYLVRVDRVGVKGQELAPHWYCPRVSPWMKRL